MLCIKRSRLKSLMGGWMEGKAGLRIAYSNQQFGKICSRPASRTTRGLFETWLAWLPEVSSKVFRKWQKNRFQYSLNTSLRTSRTPSRRSGRGRPRPSQTLSGLYNLSVSAQNCLASNLFYMKLWNTTLFPPTLVVLPPYSLW
jgi:hypothetical protein